MKISLRFSWCVALALAAASWSLAADDAAAAKKNGYTVLVEVKVDEKGENETVKIVETEDTSAGGILNVMALAMAMKTDLPPREKNGKPAKYVARLPFHFPIEGDEGAEANNAPKPRGKAGESRQPNYPEEMIQRGEVGGVIFEMIIDTEGNISRLTTLRASHPEFEAAARAGVETWKFHPAEKDGKPVESRWRIAVVFETEEKKADLKWRIAPRPSLGSFVVYRGPAEAEEAAPADGQAPAAQPAPASEAPATPAPTK